MSIKPHKVPMTIAGANKLKEELNYLKTVARKKVAEDIAEARKHGDLRENAEYKAAKEEQSFIEARILEVEVKLSNAEVIDVSKFSNAMQKVVFGATVTLINIDNQENVRYQIVGDDEANLKEQKVSVNSPIARAIIGKTIGDEVEVKAPNGSVYYEIDKIEYV